MDHNLTISVIVREFVTELGGRYKNYLDDSTIEQLLVRLIEMDKKTYPKHDLSHSAYVGSVIVFETILEYWLNAGGNGHEVAQELASKFLNI